MSVIVKHFEMPFNCAECHFCIKTEFGGYYCAAATTTKVRVGKIDVCVKHHNCPLVSIPNEHKRLIDADKLREKLWALIHDDKFPLIHITGIMAAIDATPTILDEERNENNE